MPLPNHTLSPFTLSLSVFSSPSFTLHKILFSISTPHPSSLPPLLQPPHSDLHISLTLSFLLNNSHSLLLPPLLSITLPPFPFPSLSHTHTLKEYKVDLALWGHHHLYHRSCPVYQEACVEQGTVHIVMGTGGQDLSDNVE